MLEFITYRAMLFDGFGSHNEVVSIRQRHVSEEGIFASQAPQAEAIYRDKVAS